MQNLSNRMVASSMREVTIVEVRNPITHEKKSGRNYTDFEICLKTNSKAFTLNKSSVRRRYSDFVWLRNWLSENNEGFSSIRKTPSLPPKKFIGRFEEGFLLDRMRGLQRFLRKVIEHNVFLSDKALHLFLQSSLTIKQMENYLTGKPVDCHDCIATRRIMNEDENPAEGLEQQSFSRRLSWKSSLENVSMLQKISEDNEQSSAGSDVTRSSVDRGSISGSKVEHRHTNSSEDRREYSEGNSNSESHKYESFSSFTAKPDLKQNGFENGDKLDKEIEASPCPRESFSSSLTEDQQHLESSKNDQGSSLRSSDLSDYPSSSRPIMYEFTDSDSEESTSENGDPNSSFSVIGSSSPESLITSDQNGSSVNSLNDTYGRGFIAAVPIIRSPSP